MVTSRFSLLLRRKARLLRLLLEAEPAALGDVCCARRLFSFIMAVTLLRTCLMIGWCQFLGAQVLVCIVGRGQVVRGEGLACGLRCCVRRRVRLILVLVVCDWVIVGVVALRAWRLALLRLVKGGRRCRKLLVLVLLVVYALRTEFRGAM